MCVRSIEELTISLYLSVCVRSIEELTISLYLSVCVRSIEELQQQNERLLAVVRELSEDQERNERETVDSHTKVRGNPP